MDELLALYEQIPATVCVEGCCKCCRDIIQFSPAELNNMGGYAHGGQCVHLLDGKCTIHPRRPFICRILGTSEIMPCEDCTPERLMTAEETKTLFKQYVKIKTEQETAVDGTVIQF